MDLTSSQPFIYFDNVEGESNIDKTFELALVYALKGDIAKSMKISQKLGYPDDTEKYKLLKKRLPFWKRLFY